MIDKHRNIGFNIISLSMYVDDCSNLTAKLSKGIYWDRALDKLIFSQEQYNLDQDSTEEEMTIWIWREVTSSLVKGINFTTDYLITP